MFPNVRADVQRSAGGSVGSGTRLLRALLNPSLQAILVYRLGRWILGARRRPALWPLALLAAPAYVVLAPLVRLAYDIHIHLSADIGPGLCIFHFGGIRLRGCRIGESCTLAQEVRVEPAKEGGQGPALGARVWLAPHAQILGAVTVGDGATVGAGAVVKNDVSARSLVLGNPARTVKINYDNSTLP